MYPCKVGECEFYASLNVRYALGRYHHGEDRFIPLMIPPTVPVKLNPFGALICTLARGIQGVLHPRPDLEPASQANANAAQERCCQNLYKIFMQEELTLRKK